MNNPTILFLITVSLFTAVKVISGPSIWDRLLGFNLFSSKVIMIIILIALFSNQSYLLDIALVYALLGFVGIVFIAGFIQKKGKI